MSRRIINLGTAAHNFGETQQINDMTAEMYASHGPVRFVKTAANGGDNAEDGYDLHIAKASIQNAYNSLPSTGGTVVVLPGVYDESSGLTITKDKPLALVAAYGSPWRRPNEAVTDGVVLRASGNPTALVALDNGPASVNNHYGGLFRGIHFEIEHNNTQYCIQGENWNNCLVVDCTANTDDAVTDVDQVFIKINVNSTYGNDASWWRIERNQVRQMALLASGLTGTPNQDNRHTIRANVCFGHGKTETTAPYAIALNNNHGATVRDNNVEGYAKGIHLYGSWQCTVDGNAGESVQHFCDLENTATANWVNNQGVSVPAGTDTIARLLDTNVRANIIVAASQTGSRSLYADGSVVDSATAGDNTIITPSDFASRSYVEIGSFELTGTEWPGDPDAPGANKGVLYFKDNGSGKTQLAVRFNTGAVQVLATEP